MGTALPGLPGLVLLLCLGRSGVRGVECVANRELEPAVLVMCAQPAAGSVPALSATGTSGSGDVVVVKMLSHVQCSSK